jgi:hypothetical protein
MRNKFGVRAMRRPPTTLRESQLQHTLAHFSRKGFWRRAKSRQARDFILVHPSGTCRPIDQPFGSTIGPNWAPSSSIFDIMYGYFHPICLQLGFSPLRRYADSRVSWHGWRSLTQGFSVKHRAFIFLQLYSAGVG